MRSAPSYLAATIVAPHLHTYFEEQQELGRKGGVRILAHKPELEVIESMIDIAFWISLQKEEGYNPKISFALMEPHQTSNALVFAQRIRLTSKNIVKISPAVFQAGVHLGVWHEDNSLYVWGISHTLPSACFVVQVLEPGLLVVKHPRVEGFGKFINVAILKGDEIKLVDKTKGFLGSTSPVFNSLSGSNKPGSSEETVNILIELSAAMRKHGRGGLVLVVPTDSDNWKESIVMPMNYQVDPPYRVISELMQASERTKNTADWKDSLLRAIEIIGGFTAIDGATIITQKRELIAYGAKVTRAEKSKPVSKMMVSESVSDAEPTVAHPSVVGGTRHLAGAQFVFDQRDSLALVASQDGRFTIYVWSDELKMVHAHRIDSLLM
jgi:DNA integrity scanning protein DisA with diadenylate cyclase activity